MHYKHGLLSRRAAPGTPCSALRFTTRAYPGLSHRLTGRSASTTPVAMREDLGSMCMSKAMWTVFLVSGMITPACLPIHAVERVERRDEVRLVARRACSAFERVARVQRVLVAAQMGMKGADDGLGHAQTAEKSLATSLSCLKNSPRHCVARGEGM